MPRRCARRQSRSGRPTGTVGVGGRPRARARPSETLAVTVTAAVTQDGTRCTAHRGLTRRQSAVLSVRSRDRDRPRDRGSSALPSSIGGGCRESYDPAHDFAPTQRMWRPIRRSCVVNARASHTYAPEKQTPDFCALASRGPASAAAVTCSGAASARAAPRAQPRPLRQQAAPTGRTTGWQTTTRNLRQSRTQR